MDKRIVYWFGNRGFDDMLKYYGDSVKNGTLIKTYEGSKDLSTHGSPWYETIYEFVGDDGKIYSTENGTMKVYMMEEFINICKSTISSYNQMINKVERILVNSIE